MTNNTINDVPRELLERLAEWDQFPHKMKDALTDLRAFLSAPSPAGVDGLEVVSNWVLFDAEADKPYIKKMLPEGFLAFFDCEEDARRAKANNPGTDYKRIDRVKAEDAQAIIDGLRGEVADLHTTMMAAAVEIQEHWAAHCDEEGYGPANLMHRLERGIASQYGYSAETLVRLESQRDQQAQRIGEMASHLEFAVTMLTVAGLAGNAQVEAMRAALSAGNEPKQCT